MGQWDWLLWGGHEGQTWPGSSKETAEGFVTGLHLNREVLHVCYFRDLRDTGSNGMFDLRIDWMNCRVIVSTQGSSRLARHAAVLTDERRLERSNDARCCDSFWKSSCSCDTIANDDHAAGLSNGTPWCPPCVPSWAANPSGNAAAASRAPTTSNDGSPEPRNAWGTRCRTGSSADKATACPASKVIEGVEVPKQLWVLWEDRGAGGMWEYPLQTCTHQPVLFDKLANWNVVFHWPTHFEGQSFDAMLNAVTLNYLQYYITLARFWMPYRIVSDHHAIKMLQPLPFIQDVPHSRHRKDRRRAALPVKWSGTILSDFVKDVRKALWFSLLCKARVCHRNAPLCGNPWDLRFMLQSP